MSSSSTKSYLTIREKYDRIVVLVDMDAFYCQVEERLNPSLKGKPIAVCQYQENSGIIAVNYPAKALGITRHMREREAIAACKDLVVIKVASKNGKADISKYREAGVQVAKVFQKYTSLIERASVDEAYLDITENVTKRMEDMREKKFEMQAHHFINTHAVGYDSFGKFIQDVSAAVDGNYDDIDPDDRPSYSSSKLRLLVGSSVVSDIRRGVFEETGYTCSAGIAHNKILAKLVCGMNKPNKQTIIPLNSIHGLFSKLEISKIKSMGGKTGEQVCKTLNARVMNDLLKYSEEELTNHFGPRVGKFLYLITRGIDLEKVTLKINSKSIAVSKNFRGPSEINNCNTLKFWLTQLSKEVHERLEHDALDTNRISRQLIVQFTQFIDGKNQSCSRTVQLNGNIVNNFTYEEIANEAYNIIQKTCVKFLKIEGKPMLNHGIRHLGISAGKFESNLGSNNLQNFFINEQANEEEEKMNDNEDSDNEIEDEPEAVEEIPQVMQEEPQTVEKNPQIIEEVPQLVKEIPQAMEQEPQIMEQAPQPIEEGPQNQVNCTEELKCEEKCDTETDENDIKVTLRFDDEHAIKGMKTLKHWIGELFKKFSEQISQDYSQKNCAPQEFEFRWTQSIGVNEEKTFSETIPVSIFTNHVVSTEFMVDVMMDSCTDFINKEKINPIKMIDFVPKNFKENETWKLRLFEEVNEPETEGKVIESDAEDDQMEVAELEEEFLTSELASEDTNEQEMIPSTSNPNQNYAENYVEFQQMISIDDLNPLEECLECGKMVRKYDMLIHIDEHIAWKLAQLEREQYRNEQKSKNRETKIVNIPKSKKLPITKNSIEKFTKKIDENSHSSQDNSTIQIVCDECLESINASDYQTHMDHHFAQKLRKEQLENVLKSKENSNKRKRSLPVKSSSQSTQSTKKSKNLMDFFKK